jgi:hypothetical protein
VKGSPFLLGLRGEDEEVNFFQVVFGVESGLSTVHFTLLVHWSCMGQKIRTFEALSIQYNFYPSSSVHNFKLIDYTNNE